ncbi:hypothetical protein Mterra_03340 [Calidithermus terrae]|uniref:Uncharacterized protein n=1 Tax=Calidithermus terrae TaxID=1408545 RepID=A0A399EB49_9DEIN|nr:hypothetical protein [Calidithermus terrae]RIH81168.1 hypothetical protein Mterra_03340 [Calidithermus terrae]
MYEAHDGRSAGGWRVVERRGRRLLLRRWIRVGCRGHYLLQELEVAREELPRYGLRG